MNNQFEKHFTTHDIFLSSALITLGFKIDLLDKNNPQKVEFCFLREKGLDKAIQAYWGMELQLEPQAFSASLKNLKSRIYSA